MAKIALGTWAWGAGAFGGDFRQNRDIGYYADKLCVTSKYLSEVCKKVSGLPAAFWITRYTALDISRLLRDRSLSFTGEPPQRSSSKPCLNKVFSTEPQ